jgi:hypothetical protein
MLKENLDIYFDTRYGGSNATVDGSALVGIFSNEYVEVDDGVVPVSGLKPMLKIKNSDAPAVGPGSDVIVQEEHSGVVVATRTYKVIKPEPDGTGVVDLILEEQ